MSRIRLPSYLIGTDLGSLRDDQSRESLEQTDQIEEVGEQVSYLEQRQRDLEDRTQEDEKAFISFAQQFMPGRTYVQSLIYQLVYDDIITVPGASPFQQYYPGASTTFPTTDATLGFDVSNDLQHAFYNLSAFALNENRVVVYNGTIIVGADINVGIVRVYKPSPPRLESFLTVFNAGAECQLHVKVYRTVGIS